MSSSAASLSRPGSKWPPLGRTRRDERGGAHPRALRSLGRRLRPVDRHLREGPVRRRSGVVSDMASAPIVRSLYYPYLQVAFSLVATKLTASAYVDTGFEGYLSIPEEAIA